MTEMSGPDRIDATRPTPTHLVITDFSHYEPPMIEEFSSEPEAAAAYKVSLGLDADVTLVEVRQQSKAVSRRVAEAVDQ